MYITWHTPFATARAVARSLPRTRSAPPRIPPQVLQPQTVVLPSPPSPLCGGCGKSRNLYRPQPKESRTKAVTMWGVLETLEYLKNMYGRAVHTLLVCTHGCMHAHVCMYYTYMLLPDWPTHYALSLMFAMNNDGKFSQNVFFLHRKRGMTKYPPLYLFFLFSPHLFT